MKLTIKVTGLLSAAIILFMIPAGILIWHNQQDTITQQARARALTLFQMVVVTRQWVAENRDRIEPVPAVATKELSKYANYMADFKFNITSDKLMNPNNAPSEFEERAIEVLKTGATEYSERGREIATGESVYRYAAPLMANESCLTCHSAQGYKVGDFRGVISVTIPLTDLEATIQKNNITFIVVFLLGFIIVVTIISLLLYRLVLSPIDRLTEAAGRIRKGDYSMRTNINTDDEIHELSEAFDMMSKEIAENEDTLKAKLAEAVQKYVLLVDELREKNEQLGTINQLKTDLLDSIAHEIRTPLTKIMSYSELLNDPRLQNDAGGRAKFAESLKRNISSLSSMFNDIITMSRLEHGQHPYHRIPIGIRAMVSDIIDIYDVDIKKKELDIEINIDEKFTIVADGESFYYVISNIISNSIKYAHIGGSVIISADLSGDGGALLTFYDEGVGIPTEDLDEIFSRFYRGRNVKKEYAGTGLGLSIIARVVKEHNGTIYIESELNQFTKVTITLPDE
ncbi:MAG: DUF3365 domain-containing protein [Deferribacteraceae bacterium]|jgi:signal transduction histidine kinase|nr:DUF3365 domain-containing protein [Deferribacteraceae bacterium]